MFIKSDPLISSWLTSPISLFSEFCIFDENKVNILLILPLFVILSVLDILDIMIIIPNKRALITTTASIELKIFKIAGFFLAYLRVPTLLELEYLLEYL